MNGTERNRFPAWLKQQLGTRTQGHLAEYVGVSTSTVSRWMTGKSVMEWRNVLKVAAYFKVEPEVIRDLLPDPLAEAASPPPITGSGAVTFGAPALNGRATVTRRTIIRQLSALVSELERLEVEGIPTDADWDEAERRESER